MRRPRFSRWETSKLASISHLVPAGRRCGIYVLEFDDGARYVGQARDVVRRYEQHHHKGGDIRAIEFTPVPPDDLDHAEREMIGYEEEHGGTRNHKHASAVTGPSKLDTVVAVDDQLAWLNGADQLHGDEEAVRPKDPELREAGRQQFEQFCARPGAELANAVLQHFIWATIPRPRETERRFWSITAMPSPDRGSRLVTLNVGKLETMFLYVTEFDHGLWLGGYLNTTASAVAPDVLGGALNEPRAWVDNVGARYERTGTDRAGFRFMWTEKHNGYQEVMSWPGVADAARMLVVRMMRRGLALQGLSHNYLLADVILGDAPWPSEQEH